MAEQCFFCGGPADVSYYGRSMCQGCIYASQEIEAMLRNRASLGMTEFHRAFLDLPKRYRAGTRESICRYVWDKMKVTNPELRG